jgi:V8-like Glu-specific endopeptidase
MSTWKRAERFWTKERRSTPRDRRVVPHLIALEDRVLPSAFQVVGYDPATHMELRSDATDESQVGAPLHPVSGQPGLGDRIEMPSSPHPGFLDADSGDRNGDGSGRDNVHAPDNRREVSNTGIYPWRPSGKLYIRYPSTHNFVCSGAMIDPYHFLTAGHCVYDASEGGWATNLDVELAKKDLYRPYGQAHWTYARTYNNWINSRDANWDMALITLDRRVGSYTGWYGYDGTRPDSFFNNLTIQSGGFPTDLFSGNRMIYWAFSNTADHADGFHVYYRSSTAGGQSGSSVWYDNGSGPYVINVHAYGNDPFNYGTRITSGKQSDLTNWRTQDDSARPPTDKADLTDYDVWFGTHVSSFSSSTVYQGQSLGGHTVVQNNGSRNAGAFTTRFYIATNPDLNHTNYILADGRIGGVNAYAWSYVDATGTISYGVPAGRYYLGWYFDLNNEITEFDKSNNRGAISNATFTILPGAVTLSATPLSSSQIRLNWSGTDAGATGYKIERWNGSTYVQIATTNASTLTYTDTNLTANTQYFYRVRATSAVGDGAYSAVVSPRTLAITNFIVTINPGTVTAGNSVTVTVTARDSAGNVGDGYRGTVSFTSDDSRASLPGSYAFQAGDHGQHSFTATLRTAGSHFIRATDGSITGSGTVTVLAAGLDHFTISTTAANPDVAGTAFDVTVTAFDAFNNQATGYTGTVTFSSADGGAALPADYTFTTGAGADNGRHTFAGATALVTAGTQDVTATDVNTSIGISALVNVIAAPAVYFQVDAPAVVDPGVPFDVTVTALDPYGNVDMNYAGTVTWTTTDPDPGVVLPADYTFTTGAGGDNGVHTYAGESILVTPGPDDMTATDTDSGISGTATVTVNGTGPRVSRSGKGLGTTLREDTGVTPQSAETTSQSQSRRVDEDATLNGVIAEGKVGMQRDLFFAGDGFIPLPAHRRTSFVEDWFANAGREEIWSAI